MINGKIVRRRNPDGYEEYDSNGNMTYIKTIDGYEEWNEYDSRGNLIHHRTSNGDEVKVDFKKENNSL